MGISKLLFLIVGIYGVRGGVLDVLCVGKFWYNEGKEICYWCF